MKRPPHGSVVVGESTQQDVPRTRRNRITCKFMVVVVALLVILNLAFSTVYFETSLLVYENQAPIYNDLPSGSVLLHLHSNASHQNQTLLVPTWFREYMQWHRKARAQLNRQNWKKGRYLVLRCTGKGPTCGGTSDRLKSIPLMIRLAATARPRRLFFIHWSKPCALEEFLVPAARNGIDWTLPRWLAKRLGVHERIPLDNFLQFFLYGPPPGTLEIVKDGPITRHRTLFLDRIIGAEDTYNEMRANTTNGTTDEPDFEHAYHGIWNSLFKPSAAVQAAIDQTRRDLGLLIEPEQQQRPYSAIHVRARYAVDKVDQHQEIRAIHCVLKLLGRINETTTTPTTPIIYVAADATETVRHAIHYGREHGLTVVGRENATEPLHLEHGSNYFRRPKDARSNDEWQKHAPSAYFDTFVDLYLLAGAQCISRGTGGYGHWATLIGNCLHCSNDYRMEKCPAPPAATTNGVQPMPLR